MIVNESAVGRRIHTSEAILNTNGVSSGAKPCRGDVYGWHNLFFVSGRGNLDRSMGQQISIMDHAGLSLRTPARKICQKGCGVYCAREGSSLWKKTGSGSRQGNRCTAPKRIPSNGRRFLNFEDKQSDGKAP